MLYFSHNKESTNKFKLWSTIHTRKENITLRVLNIFLRFDDPVVLNQGSSNYIFLSVNLMDNMGAQKNTKKLRK